MKKIFTSSLILMSLLCSLFSQEMECDLNRQSRLEVRLGGNERFFKRELIPEVFPIIGFSPSVHLSLPVKMGRKHYFFTKLIFGGSNNNIHFNDLAVGSGRPGIGFNGTGLYSNIYVGAGFGKHLTRKFKNNNFIRVPISLNAIYFPFVKTYSEEGFTSIPNRDYLVDIESNYDTKFSLTPEVSAEYHFMLFGCKSFSIGAYYSRSFNKTYEGEISIQRADGDIVSESYSKPFNTFGVSFSYGICRTKNSKI